MQLLVGYISFFVEIKKIHLILNYGLVCRCFESCPPRTFLPALCGIFLDCAAPDQVNNVIQGHTQLSLDLICTKFSNLASQIVECRIF